MPILFLASLGTWALANTKISSHPTFCLAFEQQRLYINKGIYISPLVVQLPNSGCVEEYAAKLKALIHQLDAPLIPPAIHVPSIGRHKRMVMLGVISTLAALLSTASMGTGISHSVRMDGLAESITFIRDNQQKIVFELNSLTESVLEMQTAHRNTFMAIKHTAELARLQGEHNACQIGHVKIQNIIQSILAHSLSNHILPPSEVMTFLRANPVLKESIYITFPSLVYRLGKIELVNIDPEKQLFTVLILLPHINQDPDGTLFTPLYAPRFHVSENRTFLESTPKLSPLFKLGTGPLDNTPLSSMKVQNCKFINHGAICPMSSQYFDDSTLCTNLLLRNTTDDKQLTKDCGLRTHTIDSAFHTSVSESPTSLILFTNENTQGVTKAGSLSILPKGSPPSCILINKLHLSSLVVGNKTFILNIRTDVFALNTKEQSVVTHLLAVEEPLPSREKVDVSPLDPKSYHFAASIMTVITVSMLTTCVFGGLIVTIFVLGIKPKIPLVVDPLRASAFLEKRQDSGDSE